MVVSQSAAEAEAAAVNDSGEEVDVPLETGPERVGLLADRGPRLSVLAPVPADQRLHEVGL
jgi:hypothetical protein